MKTTTYSFKTAANFYRFKQKLLNSSFYLTLLLLGCLLFSGCSTAAPKKPAYIQHYNDTAFNYGSKSTNVGTLYFRTMYDKASPGTEKRLVRDRICFDLLSLIDVSYNNFESQMTGLKDGKDFATDIAVFGLNAAGAATGTAEAKSILAAISGSVVGVNATADKVFLKAKTIEVLQLQMQALRNKQLVIILKKIKESDEIVYPLEAMLRDITEYYYAGTVPRAFQALSEKVGQEGATASAELKSVNMVK